MAWTNLGIFVALVLYFCGCAAFPSSQTKNDLKEIVSSLIDREHEKQSIDQALPEVDEDEPALDRKPETGAQGDYERFGKEPIAKRVPWYGHRNFYDGFKRFGGGGFDSINHYSTFGKFQKRKNGKATEGIGGSGNLLDRLKRAPFDSIHHYSNFGRFSKRSVDRASFARSYMDDPAWKRWAFDSIHHYSDFGKFSKRK